MSWQQQQSFLASKQTRCSGEEVSTTTAETPFKTKKFLELLIALLWPDVKNILYEGRWGGGMVQWPIAEIGYG